MRVTAIVILTLFLPGAVAAQEAASQKKQELIRELIVVTEAKKNAIKIIDSIVEEMNKQYPQIVERLANAEPGLTPSQRRRAKEILSESHSQFSARLLERIKQRIDIGEVTESVSSALYDKFFSEEEIADLITFYKTPTGRKTLSVLPELFAESIQRTSDKLSPTLTSIIMEIMEEEKERIKRIK